MARCRNSARSLGLYCVVALLFSTTTLSASNDPNLGISSTALEQIQAAINEKRSRTPEQKKIDSQLLYALKIARNDPTVSALAPTLLPGVVEDAQGQTVVDIAATINDDLLANLRAYGAEIIAAVPNYRSVRARVRLDQLELIASLPEVKFIQPEQQGDTAAARANRVRAKLSEELASRPRLHPSPNSGSVLSEGDRAHEADRARGTFNVNGTGVKVGVLSDGVRGLGEAQGRGDLPVNVTILPGQAGPPTGAEGTAMLEIVHDLAPGAELFFATAFTGPAQYAQNIRDLRTAGCDIIVDDVFYFNESPFQDGQGPGVISTTNGGIIAQAVIDVTSAGAEYFSAAGNAGNVNKLTGGAWEGDFFNGGSGTGVLTGAGFVHDFNGLPAGGTSNQITVAAAGSPITLFWSDPLGGSGNDYDLYVLNSASTAIVGAGTNIQDGTQDPFEQVGSAANAVSNRIVIAKFSGLDRYVHVNTNRGTLQFKTSGQIRGHSASALAYSVAATPAANANGAVPPNTVGPFPGIFNTSHKVEVFSSDGPRRLFFNGDGTPKTPGNFSSSGGELRQKPDITAADGVQVTGGGGFSFRFYGTSASAPHAAAIAALVKSSNPAITQGQIRVALTTSSIDIEAPGTDRDSGSGIVNAFAALQASGAIGLADLTAATVTAAEIGGNANTFLEPGEQGTITVELRNSGLQSATSIMATLTTSAPGVTITPPASSAYPNIDPAGAATNSIPFRFVINGASACASSMNFTLTVAYTGGPSPKVLNFTIGTGPSASISETLDAIPPVNGTYFTATTATQTGRLLRDGNTSSCAFNKGNPGLNDMTAGRRFDAYTFPNPSPTSQCVTLNLSSSSGASLQVAAYAGSFNPADPSANYVADYGTSTNFLQFSANLAGGQNLVVVVNELNVPGGSPPSFPYVLTATGLGPPCAAAPANQPPVNSVPAAQNTNENTLLVFSSANSNLISVSDADAGDNPLRVTLTATVGTITLSGTAGLTFSAGDGTADATMTFAGGNPSINNALAGLAFNPLPGDTGAASLTITTNDQGFIGPTAQSDTDAVVITINPGGTLQFSSATPAIAESGGTATITVSRAGGSAGLASVNYSITSGTATSETDYTATSGVLNFGDGELTKTFDITITNDTTDEANETINLALSNVAGTATLGVPSTAILTIDDDDAAPSLSINDITVIEGSGPGNAFFTVLLSAASELTVTVNAATADGTAITPVDYQSVTTTLTFNPGEITKTMTVPIVGDLHVEVNETFVVNLTAPTNASISDNQGSGTIANDDVFSAPANFVAAATSTSEVALSWNAVVDASGYQIYRSFGNAPYTLLTAVGTTAHVDSTVAADKTYLYKVCATGPGGTSPTCAIDAATTMFFTDAPINIGDRIKAVHITQLRTAVNLVRAAAGLDPYMFSDPTLGAGTRIKAVHVTELRTALDQARAIIPLPSLNYTDAVITVGVTTMKREHINELRNGAK